MTPWELRRAVDQLRDSWNALFNQVYGPGSRERSDLSGDVVNWVTQGYSSFRKWYDTLNKAILTEMLGLYEREFNVQLSTYQEIRKRVEQELSEQGKGEELSPQAPDLAEYDPEPVQATTWLLIGAVGALGVLLVLSRK